VPLQNQQLIPLLTTLEAPPATALESTERIRRRVRRQEERGLQNGMEMVVVAVVVFVIRLIGEEIFN
jgi:hypothetical protein